MSKSFGRGAAALAVIGIISKVMGALYRVPLTNILGAEGMGLYQTVFPVFTVLLMICGGGMTGAVSRTVAKYTARGQKTAVKDIFVASVIPLVGFSVIAAATVMLLRNKISALQGVPAAGGAYLALCPSLVVCSVISVLRGVFQGRSMMLPSGISQLIEQGIKLALGLALGKLLMPRGVEYAVFGALAGVTASEVAALLYLSVRYALYAKNKLEGSDASSAPTRRELFKEVTRFSLPVTVGLLIIPITQVFDSGIVVNMLVGSGTERGEATALFGLFVGPVGTLINMPAVVLSSLSAAFLPALTAFIERGDGESGSRESAAALKWTLILSIPIAAAFMLFPKSICSLLYGAGLSDAQIDTAATLLRIEAVSVLYLGIISYSTAVLQAHGRALRPAINLGVGATVKIALAFLLIPRFGIAGAAAANAACYGVAALFDAFSVRKYALGASAELCLRPLVFSAAACAVFYILDTALGGGTASVIVSGASFLLVYSCIIPSMEKGERMLPLLNLTGNGKRVKK